MGATSGKQMAVGLRYAVAFALNSSGTPAASSTTVYEGVQFEGAKAYELTFPEARRITHVGDDRVLAVDYLPPTESVAGKLQAAKNNFTLDALLSGVKTATIGEATVIAKVTDQQGVEPQIGLLLYQQSLDAVSRLRRWRWHILPLTKVIPLGSGMGDQAAVFDYQIAPTPTVNHLWGTALSSGTEGATEAVVIEGMSEGKPIVVAFEGDGVEDEFLFPTSKPAINTSKVAVWQNGVAVPAGAALTVTTTKITFTAAPADGDRVVVFYEW